MKEKEETGPFRRAEHFRQLREERDDARESTRILQVREVRRATLGAAPVPGASNWLPIGPALVSNGQAATLPSISGRLTVVEVTEDGTVYAGAANGGVWRSDDRGHSWIPLMDGVTRSGAGQQSNSLAVGALAVPRQDPNRLYVGTGEGGMGFDGYFGVGPLRSDDRGGTWVSETWPGGQAAFYQLAIDPADPDRVLGGTTQGLLLRQPNNQYAKGLPWPRPTSYRYRYDAATGVISAQYWAADGRNTVDAVGGAGNWGPSLQLRSLQLDSSPFLLVYRATAAGGGGLGPGTAQVVPIPSDGRPPVLGAGTAWGQNLIVFDFPIDGEHYLCRYDNTVPNGTARLARLAQPFTGAFADVGAVMNWMRWGQVVPLLLSGVPYVLLYEDLTNGQGRRAHLRRWSPALTLEPPVWQSDDRFAAAQVLVPFEHKSEQLLLQYDPTNGNIAVFRFAFDGEPVRIWRANGRLLPNATLEPFVFLDRRDGGYRRRSLLQATSADGTVALYDWHEKLETVWKELGPAGQAYTPFAIGYRWFDVSQQLTPRPRGGIVTSVAITQSGRVSRYYATVQLQGWSLVYVSTDQGRTWTQLGQLTAGGRLSLGVQRDNPDIVYAFAQDSSLHRLDHRDGRGWRTVVGTPANNVLAMGQGWYDLAIAVSPEDPNTVFLGGQTVYAASSIWRDWSAAIYRCRIEGQNGELRASPVYLGASVHADVHGFCFTPGRANELWVACDGGLFFTSDARRQAASDVTHLFEPRNSGLGTMTVNRSMKWGDEDSITFSSNQDNGLQLRQGGMLWNTVTRGDSGISLRNGTHVLATFEKLKLAHSNQSGRPTTFGFDGRLQLLLDRLGDKMLFYPPMAQLTGTANVVAGTMRPWISADLGLTWFVINTLGAAVAPVPAGAAPAPQPLDNTDANQLTALVWATPTRFYAGTQGGIVRRYDLAMGNWGATNTPMPLPRPVTSLTLGANADTVLVTVGGGAGPRVYELVTTAGPPGVWNPLMGGGARTLPDIPMTTLAHGGANELFVGSDIGVWRSQDDGAHWDPYSQGLPESAVLDLQYFPALVGPPRTRPALLRASTHGRGVWDRVVAANAPDVKLLLRVNLLDSGLENRRTAADPVDAAVQCTIRDGACIKTNRRNPDGSWPLPAVIPWDAFHLQAVDRSRELQANQPVRLYIEVHDRGVAETRGAYLTLFVSHAYAPLVAPLPANLMAWPDPPQMRPDYWQRVANRELNRDARYDIPAIVGVPRVGVEQPQVVSVDLPASSFPAAGFYCVVVIASSPEDSFFNQQRDIDALVTGDRLVASKFLAVN